MTGEPLRRGVDSPAVVDLVRRDERRGQVVLVAIERRPWGQGREQLEQLNDKLSNYFVYVLDGHLASQYPQYAGMPVRIQLDCVEEPSGETLALLQNASAAALEHGLALMVRVVDPEEIPLAPWERPPASAG